MNEIIERNQALNVGDIIVKSVGYSMVIYNFYKVKKNNGITLWLQPMNKETVYDSDAPYYGHPNVIPTSESVMPVIRRSVKTHVGWLWNGEPLEEDHMD